MGEGMEQMTTLRHYLYMTDGRGVTDITHEHAKRLLPGMTLVSRARGERTYSMRASGAYKSITLAVYRDCGCRIGRCEECAPLSEVMG